MRCEKCGAEWNGSMTSGAQKCPFCGEILSEDIPYKQVVDSLRMLIDRFGCDIYLEEQRLDAMVNDLVPNALKEKHIRILSGKMIFGTRHTILQKSMDLIQNGVQLFSLCSAIL